LELIGKNTMAQKRQLDLLEETSGKGGMVIDGALIRLGVIYF